MQLMTIWFSLVFWIAIITYDVFDSRQHFEANHKHEYLHYKVNHQCKIVLWRFHSNMSNNGCKMSHVRRYRITSRNVQCWLEGLDKMKDFVEVLKLGKMLCLYISSTCIAAKIATKLTMREFSIDHLLILTLLIIITEMSVILTS